jgi:glycosyltransferase involved in cell wall biosynthesis
MNDIKYSVILPVYNEEGTLEILYERLTKVLQSISPDYEIIFIDDNSRDNSFKIMSEICNKDSKIRIIKFSRNFGHQAAITAGLDHARGDALIMMDADLQDPPEVIVQLVDKYKEGYDVVYAKREKRTGESLFKLWTASAFYRLINYFTDIDIPLDTGDFRLINRKVIDSLKSIQEKNRFLRGLITWVGYRQTGVNYVRDARYAGETKFTIRKMMRFAIDGISSFSHIPLRMATLMGLVVSLISFLLILWVFYFRFSHVPTPGWASLMVTVTFIGGIQLITIGIIGEYLGRIYDEVKNRPLYIVDRVVGIQNNKMD